MTWLRLINPRGWSERTLVVLAMQSLDNSITTYTERGRFGRRKFTSKQGHGEPNPTFIAGGDEVNLRLAEHIGGVASGSWGEVFGMPDDGSLSRRRTDRDIGWDRRHRSVPPHIQLSGLVRR